MEGTPEEHVDINTRVTLHTTSRLCGHEGFSAVATAAAVTAPPGRTAAGGTVRPGTL